VLNFQVQPIMLFILITVIIQNRLDLSDPIKTVI
jgi:hypothetical protein